MSNRKISNQGGISSPRAAYCRHLWLVLAVLLLAAAVQICAADEATDAYEKGIAALEKQDRDSAITHFDEAIKLNPKYGEAFANRGFAYYLKREYDKALSDFSRAIQLDMKAGGVYYLRGVIYQMRGEYAKAAADYRDAFHLDADDPRIFNSLAWLLAVCPDAKVRDGKKAVDFAKRACELTEWKEGYCWDTLAAAYAEAGDFEEAVKWQQKYVDSNPPKEFAEDAQKRLELYKQKRPYHEENMK